ncbi:MAG TPA: tetratricopeptide repeat protein [Gemmata sp.]|nr:tetratricopeptide repeat protein [Gemmata sp.]
MPLRFATTLLSLALLGSLVTAARSDEPKTAEEFLQRGHMWYRKGEWDKAIKDYSEVIRLAPKDPNGYYQRGCARGEKRELKEAIEDFTEAIRLDPNNAAAYSMRGNSKVWARDFPNGVKDLDRAIRLNPKDVAAFISRGSANSALGNYDQAINDLTEAIRLNPKIGVAHRYRALAWCCRGEFIKCNDDLNEAITLDPKDAEAYAIRAMNFAAWPDDKLRDGKKAMANGKKACELTGWKVGYPLEAYAAACAECGNFEEAVNWQKKVLDDSAYMKMRSEYVRERLQLYKDKKPYRFDSAVGQLVFPTEGDVPIRDKDGKMIGTWSVGAGKVLAVERERLLLTAVKEAGPRNGWVSNSKIVKLADAPKFYSDRISFNAFDLWAWRNRAEVWLHKAELAKAIADLDEVIRLDPTYALAFSARGFMRCEMKDYAKAIQDYDEAIRLDPTDGGSFHRRGLAWMHLKEYVKAFKDLDDAIRLEPKNGGAFNDRGVAHLRRGDYENAVTDFDVAIRLGCPVYENRGEARLLQRKYEQAIKDLDIAIRLDANKAHAFYYRGNAWSELGEKEKAIKDYDEAIRLAPKVYQPFVNRGNARYILREYDKAIKDYEEAIRLEPKHPHAYYWKASCYAMQSKDDLAIEALGQAFEVGWRDFKSLESNRAFDRVRDDPRYKKLIEQFDKDAPKE